MPTVCFVVAVAVATAFQLLVLSPNFTVRHPGWNISVDFPTLVLIARAGLGPHGLEHLYATAGGGFVVALPGLEIFLMALMRGLTAVGMGAPALGLTFDHGRPLANYAVGSSWDVLVPVTFALGLSGVFAAAALMRRTGARGGTVAAATVTVALALAWVEAWWGHPEDAIAVSLVLFALWCALAGRWSTAAWLLGFGIAFQTVVLLAVPMVLLWAGVRQWPRLVPRMALPGLLAVLVPLVGDPGDTLRQILRQPAYPTNGNAHPTPWIWVVPHPLPRVVDAGWPRSLALILAVVVALVVVRHRPARREDAAAALVWGVAACLSLRLACESVVFPYYLCVVLVFVFVAVPARGRLRTAAAFGVAALALAANWVHLGPWGYWLVMVAALCLLLALCSPFAIPRPHPGRARREPASRHGPASVPPPVTAA